MHNKMASLHKAIAGIANKFNVKALTRFQMDAITTFVDGEEDIFINLPTGYGKSLIYQYELANVVNCFWLVVCCTCGRIVGPIISYIRRTNQRNNPRSAHVFSSVASII